MVFYIVLVILIVFTFGIVAFLIYERQVTIKEIKNGEVDSQIIYEDHEEKMKEVNKKHKILKKSLNIGLDILIGLLGILFLLGLVDKIMNNSALPIKTVVIATGSMSTKNEENEYLFENKLDNQIQVNDLIFLEKVNSLDEIKLYDIICYRNDNGQKIVHRVVEINDEYLLTQGDANNVNDGIEIDLDRIVGKYNGMKVPGIGAVTFFLTSDYGISTIASILLISIAYTFVKTSIDKEINKRLIYLASEVGTNQNYILLSTSGSLIVNEGIYTYKENEEKEKKTIETTLKIDNETKILKKEKSKWRKN